MYLKTLKPYVIESAAVDAAIIVEGFIAKRLTQMLVDTGSAVTIFREDTWQDGVGDRGQLNPSPRPVIAADGDELEVLGLGDVTARWWPGNHPHCAGC